MVRGWGRSLLQSVPTGQKRHCCPSHPGTFHHPDFRCQLPYKRLPAAITGLNALLQLKRFRQQLINAVRHKISVAAHDNDPCFITRKFTNLLPAATAGCAVLGLLLAADDGYCHYFPAPVRHHCANCIGLGAAALRKRRVLNIAANMQLAVLIQQRRADKITGIGGMGTFTYLLRFLDEFIVVHRLLRFHNLSDQYSNNTS